jgi:hypothetical protein
VLFNFVMNGYDMHCDMILSTTYIVTERTLMVTNKIMYSLHMNLQGTLVACQKSCILGICVP